MDFRFTEEQESFRKEIQDFVKQYPPEEFPTQAKDEHQGLGGWSFEYTRLLGSKGWLSLTWPKECYGQNRSLFEGFILEQELAYHKAPLAAHLYSSFVAKSIIAVGSADLKAEFLPLLAKGEISFCQGFSEPNAGSDLFALQTKATERDTDYVLTGQKIWTSFAPLAHYGVVLARTDPNVPKHKGLTSFIVDMKSPGISIRPIRDMWGTETLAEVFFDEVSVPKENIIGEKNGALTVILLGIEADRFWGRIQMAAHCKRILDDLVAYIKEEQGRARCTNLSSVRHMLAQRATEIEVCNMLFLNGISKVERGQPLTYEGSIAKVFADELGQRLSNTGMKILGLYNQLEEDSKWSPLKGEIEGMYLSNVSNTIGGGAEEVVRDTIAVRGLGLPRYR